MLKTTDDQHEIFDVVNENDQVIGQTTRREANTSKHLMHRSIYVVVFNTKGEVFLQQRSATKDTEPLCWTVSCAGHVVATKTYEETAHRELAEELGRDLDLEFVDKIIVRFPYETEISAIYKAYFNGPFQLNSVEIERGEFFSNVTIKRAVENNKIILAYSGKVILNHLGWL